jgi:4-hydroxy-tetrahydrodipicolinate synthase
MTAKNRNLERGRNMSLLTPEGIIVAMVTPFGDDGELNLEVAKVLLNRIVAAGAHGVFVVSGAGEFLTLSMEEKKKLIELSVEYVDGRVPVFAGTGATSTREANRLTRMAEEIGANAVSVIAPCGLRPSQDELESYYLTIARCTRLPLILYNHPTRSGVTLSTDLVKRLSTVENIVGIKDSSGDLVVTAGYLAASAEGFSVLAGIDTLILASLVYGATGAVSSTACLAPVLAVQLYNDFKANDYTHALEAQQSLSQLRNTYSLGTFPAVLKAALKLVGIDVGDPRSPVNRLGDSQAKKLRGVLSNLGLVPPGKSRQNRVKEKM